MADARLVEVDITGRTDGQVPSWDTASGKHVYLTPSGVPSGTSFPGTPSDGDLFHRTDRRKLYEYDGTRWLTEHEFVLPFVINDSLAPATANGAGKWRAVPEEGDNGLWIVKVSFKTLSLTTNDGTKYWTVQVWSQNASGTQHNLGSSFNTSADTQDAYQVHEVTVGAQMTAGDVSIGFSYTKTSTPGNFYAWAVAFCRFIG